MDMLTSALVPLIGIAVLLVMLLAAVLIWQIVKISRSVNRDSDSQNELRDDETEDLDDTQ
jgi:hypothetical protein